MSYQKAKDELDILVRSSEEDNRPIVEEFIPEILALVKKFSESGQSGGSAPYTAAAISQTVKKLCLNQPICPITGIDEEWINVTEYNDKDGTEWYQNKRESSIFKDGKDGKAYYLDAIVWQGEDEFDSFIGMVENVTSRQYIKSFPFEPKTFRINVRREPYNPKLHIDKRIVTCGSGDMVYFIKDLKQLDEVWEYYDRFSFS